MEFESNNWLSRIIIFATVYDDLYCDQYSKLSNVNWAASCEKGPDDFK